MAPNTVFGGEFGFIGLNRRHRLVQIYNDAGTFDKLVLIREFRAGSGAEECAPTSANQLVGTWEGKAATISANCLEPDIADCHLVLGETELEGLRLLPDGGLFSPASAGQPPRGIRAGGLLVAVHRPDEASDSSLRRPAVPGYRLAMRVMTRR